METPIIDALYRMAAGERWHTPGHKGREPTQGDFLHWRYDVTEAGEFDVGHGSDVVAESQTLLAEQMGVRRLWYSVQGATLPVTVGILGSFERGQRVAIERHAHRSVMAAMILGDLDPVWLPARFGLGALPLPAREPDLARVDGIILTRPTYDGVTDTAGTAQIIAACHAQGKVVVVDEAHGSHFAGRDGFPLSALHLKADVVAHGIHKTEATLTQTGVLYCQGDRVDPEALDRWWRLLSTSSPSYLLLASLDRWQAYRDQQTVVWNQFAEAMRKLWKDVESRGYEVFQAWAEHCGWNADPAKFTLIGPGREWERRLRPLGIAEKVEPGSITLVLSPEQLVAQVRAAVEALPLPNDASGQTFHGWPSVPNACSPRTAWFSHGQWVKLDEARGRIARQAVTPYPPGVPCIVAGEIYTAGLIEAIQSWQNTVTGHIEGMRPEAGHWKVEVLRG